MYVARFARMQCASFWLVNVKCRAGIDGFIPDKIPWYLLTWKSHISGGIGLQTKN